MGIKLSEVEYSYVKDKKHDVIVNKNISLEINNNDEFIAIVGHTGSGKSTLVQLLNGLLIPNAGLLEVSFKDNGNICNYKIKGHYKKPKYSLTHSDTEKVRFKSHIYLKPLRSHIGLVFQFPEYQIFEETVLKDIMFGPKNFTNDIKKAEEKARHAASIMEISDLLDLNPFVLSGGQMRKVAIAGILAMEPDVLVLDEPTVGLDPLSKKELLQFLKKQNEELHKTIIIITHDMDVVGEFAKRVIVMNKGEIKYDGSKEELFKNKDVVYDNNLDYPSIIKLMIGLKEKLNIDIDPFQYNINDAYLEIKRVMGEHYE